MDAPVARRNLKDDAWVFFAEGFNSAIFKYAGTDPTWVGKVLRMGKYQNPEYIREGQAPPENFVKTVIVKNEFLDKLIKADLPAVDVGEIVVVSNAILSKLAAEAEPKRSELRKRQSYLATDTGIAVIHEDHAGDPLVIEVKPKCGFLPSKPPVTMDIKTQISRFQLHQRLKKKQGLIKEISTYDPLDLFSGDLARVQKAVAALRESPQGNLKVFRFGAVSALEEKEVARLAAILNGADFLSQLLALQKLDVYDAENMPAIYAAAGCPCWADLLSDGALRQAVLKRRVAFKPHMTKDESRIAVAAFLIAQAAKDASVMISCDEDWTVKSLAVIDLDMKEPGLLAKAYAAQDRQIVEAYLEAEGEAVW